MGWVWCYWLRSWACGSRLVCGLCVAIFTRSQWGLRGGSSLWSRFWRLWEKWKVSQAVWKKAGLFVADVVSFVWVPGWLMGLERQIWFGIVSWLRCILQFLKTWFAEVRLLHGSSLEAACVDECGLLSKVKPYVRFWIRFTEQGASNWVAKRRLTGAVICGFKSSRSVWWNTGLLLSIFVCLAALVCLQSAVVIVVSAWQCRRQLFVHGNKLIWRVIEVAWWENVDSVFDVTGSVTACPVTAALPAFWLVDCWYVGLAKLFVKPFTWGWICHRMRSFWRIIFGQWLLFAA